MKGIEKKRGTLAPKGIAEGGDVAVGYLIYMETSTDAAHPTIKSLSRHILKNGGIRQLNTAALLDEGETEQTIEFTCAALLGACYATGQVLGKSMAAPEVKVRMDELLRLKGLA